MNEQQIDNDFDDGARFFKGIGIALGIMALLAIGIWYALVAHASTYTRDGGTADWQCCSDKTCSTIISQHADSVRARDACGALTDKDGVTRYVRSNAFRIAPSSTTTPPPPPPPPATASLVFSPTIGGTFAALDGATVSGNIGVKVSDCSLVAPVTMTVDGIAVNTENGCPFWLVNDDTLYDTTKLANGSHVFEARTAALTLKATVTVNNAAPVPPSGSATLSWTPPTTNTDGSPLTNLAGWRIEYGPVGPAGPGLNQTLSVNGASLTSYVVSGLASGTWAFAVHAVNAAGAESVQSNIAQKVVP